MAVGEGTGGRKRRGIKSGQVEEGRREESQEYPRFNYTIYADTKGNNQAVLEI